MKLKLTRQSVEMLSRYLEKEIRSNCDIQYPPEWHTIAWWIADWAKAEMIKEAEATWAHIVSD